MILSFEAVVLPQTIPDLHRIWNFFSAPAASNLDATKARLCSAKQNGNVLLFYFSSTLFITALSATAPFSFHFVGGCWKFGIEPETTATSGLSDNLTTQLDLIRNTRLDLILGSLRVNSWRKLSHTGLSYPILIEYVHLESSLKT